MDRRGLLGMGRGLDVVIPTHYSKYAKSWMWRGVLGRVGEKISWFIFFQIQSWSSSLYPQPSVGLMLTICKCLHLSLSSKSLPRRVICQPQYGAPVVYWTEFAALLCKKLHCFAINNDEIQRSSSFSAI